MEKLNKITGFLIMCVVAAVFAFREPPPAPEDAWFNQSVLQSSRPVVVKFGADWCGPCRSMDQSLDTLQSGFSGRARFLRINVDEKPELFAHYGSGSGIPQIMIFRDGEVVARQRGFGGTGSLREWLAQNL